jgi:TPR repeat protein
VNSDENRVFTPLSSGGVGKPPQSIRVKSFLDMMDQQEAGSETDNFYALDLTLVAAPNAKKASYEACIAVKASTVISILYLSKCA